VYFVARYRALGWDLIADDHFKEMNWASLPINPENSWRTLLNSLVMLSDTFIDCERRMGMLDGVWANIALWTRLEEDASLFAYETALSQIEAVVPAILVT
jgi:hypothetical protein